MDSWQLTILKALTQHLQGITPTNGYDFDMADKVFRGRLVYGDDDPLPLISIVEHLSADVSVDVAGENNIARHETWVLLIQGWVVHASDNPTDDAYNLKAAVEHRLARLILMNPATGDPMYPSEYFLGLKSLRVITGMTIGPGVVSTAARPDGATSARAFFYLPLGIGLATNISEPFAP
jgi:hypothetical protein